MRLVVSIGLIAASLATAPAALAQPRILQSPAISRDLIVDDERYFAEHNVNGLLRGDHTSRAAFYVSALQNGWMTINEIREAENLNPIGPEGDKHFVQLNMTTLDKMGQEPPAPAAEVEDSPADDTEDQAEEEDAADGT